jgi:hypothetical protein
METLLMQIQSFCILLIMTAGIIFRYRRKLHVKLMSIAIVWDVLLILQIELSRSAIVKASRAASNATALNIHVSIAVTTVILYGFMIYTGRKMLDGQNSFRKRHRILGFSTYLMRILTFITSLWAVTPGAGNV